MGTSGFYLLMLIFDAIGYWALACYLDSVFASSFGVGKPWYYPITDTWNYFLKSAGIVQDDESNDTLALMNSDDVEDDPEYCEPVPDSLKIKRTAVKVRHLVKEFKVAGTTKRAVNDFNLTVYSSEIFALLG